MRLQGPGPCILGCFPGLIWTVQMRRKKLWYHCCLLLLPKKGDQLRAKRQCSTREQEAGIKRDSGAAYLMKGPLPTDLHPKVTHCLETLEQRWDVDSTKMACITSDAVLYLKKEDYSKCLVLNEKVLVQRRLWLDCRGLCSDWQFLKQRSKVQGCHPLLPQVSGSKPQAFSRNGHRELQKWIRR